MGAPRPLLRAPTPFDDEADVHLVVLHLILQAALGEGYVDWDLDALKLEITERWGAPGQVAWQRVAAGTVLASNSMAWEEWGVFEKVANAVAGEFPDFAFVQPAAAEDVARTLATMAWFTNDEKFSDDVLGYMAAACLEDGVWYLEAPLDVAGDAMRYLLDTRDLKLPFDEVTALLARKTTIANPDTAAEHQVNAVLDVRRDVIAFRGEVAAQTLQYVKE